MDKNIEIYARNDGKNPQKRPAKHAEELQKLRKNRRIFQNACFMSCMYIRVELRLGKHRMRHVMRKAVSGGGGGGARLRPGKTRTSLLSYRS